MKIKENRNKCSDRLYLYIFVMKVIETCFVYSVILDFELTVL